MSRKKEKYIELILTGITHKGESIGRTEEGIVVFVQGGVPGDKVNVLLLRKRKGVWNGIVKNVIEHSPDRTIPICQHFDYCGGCSWQNLQYIKQLQLKEKIVHDAVKRIAKLDQCEVEPILGCKEEYYYRNKLEFTFSNRRWLLPEEVKTNSTELIKNALGFHRAGVYDKILDIQSCHLQIDLNNQIRNAIRKFTLDNNYEFYDIKNHTGLLRNLVIKTNEKNEALVLISFSEFDPDKITHLFNFLQSNFKEIVSAYYSINTKKNDSWHDLECIKIYGNDYLLTHLHHAKYSIGPKSFFQTNRVQGENLYALVKDYADLSGKETVYDLYCGVGSIGIYIANQVNKLVGIEEIPEAIADAEVNARLNQLSNYQFLAGDVKALLTEELTQQHGLPDIVIVDPPRVGIHQDVIEKIIQFSPKKIVYVSCNPSTAARDFALFNTAYEIVKVRPVDMFPMTNHIELVSLLIKR